MRQEGRKSKGMAPSGNQSILSYNLKKRAFDISGFPEKGTLIFAGKTCERILKIRVYPKRAQYDHHCVS